MRCGLPGGKARAAKEAEEEGAPGWVLATVGMVVRPVAIDASLLVFTLVPCDALYTP